MQRTLIIVGAAILIVGLLWPWLSQLHLGRLPGDIVIDKRNFKLYLPLTTMIVASVAVSLLLWLFRR